MEAFLQILISTAATATASPISCANDPPVDERTGILTLKVGDSKCDIPVMEVFMQYSSLGDADAKDRFVSHVLSKYLDIDTSNASKGGTATLTAVREKVLPLLVSEKWVEDKKKILRKEDDIPVFTLEGQPGLNHGLGVVLTIDFGQGLSPVLQQQLVDWGLTFDELKVLGLRNLALRTKEVKWDVHPTGCAFSQWKDGFDATRAALLPECLSVQALEEPPVGPPSDGDVVCVFGTHHQCIMARAGNPLGICFMGECVLDVETKHTAELLCPKPFRLGPCSINRFVWVPYESGSDKEFCMPTSFSQCDAILSAIQKGKPIPKFEPPAPGTAEREKGNARFVAKDYKGAIQHYTDAIQLAPQDVRHLPLSNRAVCYLELQSFEKCIADCDEALGLVPNYGKALYRRGCAYMGLKNYEMATKDFEKMKEVDPGSKDLANRKIQIIEKEKP